jgi:putative hydrolase of the HAD superfamily
MNSRIQIQEQRKLEGLHVLNKIAAVSLRTAGILENTGLLNDQTNIEPMDVVTIRNFLQIVSPINIENYQLHAHLQLTAKFARNIGDELKSINVNKYAHLNLDELEILALLHDFGRFFSHRFFRNDLLADYVLRRVMEFRGDLLKKLVSLRYYMRNNIDDNVVVQNSVENLSTEQRILEIADICGKRIIQEGVLDGIMPFDDVMVHHNNSRRDYKEYSGLDYLWPSERTLNHELIVFSERVYRRINSWLMFEGVNLNNLREKIQQEEMRSPIKAVIFDVGGVLLRDPDQDIKRQFFKAININMDDAETIWSKLIKLLQTGKITESEFLNQLIGKAKIPSSDFSLQILEESVSININSHVKDIANNLKKKGLIVAILSDTIPSHITKLRRGGVYDDFSPVVTSQDIKVTKARSEAFSVMALRLHLPPQACVFIDDKPHNVEIGGKSKMKSIQYISDQELKRNLLHMNLL